jgi:hypothetical protein
MEIGGLGITEIIILLTVLLLSVGGPVVLIVALVLFNRGKKANAGMKKCAFCAYSIPIEATVCQFCSREVGQSGRSN